MRNRGVRLGVICFISGGMNRQLKMKTVERLRRQPTCCLRKLENGPLPSIVHSIPLKDSDIITQYRLHKAKSEIMSAQKNAKAHIDFIIQEQQHLTVEIESLRKAIKDLEFLISSSKCKTMHPKKLSDLCKVKSSLKVDLSNILQLEKRLKQQLHEARGEYRNANLDEHIVNEDIKKFKNKSWDNHGFDKEFFEQLRIKRELQCKKNAISVREGTISSVANSITVHVMQKLPGEHNASQKLLRNAKSARENVSKYLSHSAKISQETKAVAQTEAQIRQRRQKQNLAQLKKEINEIKKNLAVKSHLRRIHDEEIAIEKEEVKSLLQAQGANPYLAEYLLAIEEKQRDLQRKMLVEEQKRLLDMQREYSAIEASKAKEEADRKKWEQFWSNRAIDKLLHERRSRIEMYFDVPGDEDHDPVHEHIKTELQVKVDEQLHQRLSHNQAHFDEFDLGNEEEIEEEEEVNLKFRQSQHSQQSSAGETSETFPEPEEEVNFKPHRKSVESGLIKKKKSIPQAQVQEKPSKAKKGKVKSKLPLTVSEETTVEASLRKAVHLDETQKHSLLHMAEDGENSKAMLMSGRNVFDFGYVPVGERKYIMVNVANMGVDTVKLKMSVLNPYGPFTFCNSLKNIPQDSYFSLKFKYQPVEAEQESQETLKIEEVGKPENFIIVKLKGYSLGVPSEE